MRFWRRKTKPCAHRVVQFVRQDGEIRQSVRLVDGVETAHGWWPDGYVSRFASWSGYCYDCKMPVDGEVPATCALDGRPHLEVVGS